MTFLEKLDQAVTKNNSLLCVGLDPDLGKLPPQFVDDPSPYLNFCKAIVDATHDLVCAYKPNTAFFEARGAVGIEELQQVCAYIQQIAPGISIILDFKRGDIGNTNTFYANFAFDYIQADAVTVHPWSGREGMQAFLDYQHKGIIVWCKGSNPGSGEFQDLEIDGQKLYMHVAQHVARDWNANGNCLLVVGATYPTELSEVRATVGDDMVLLVPGIGAQGGDIEASVKAGVNSAGRGIIISTTRVILYASQDEDFAAKARTGALNLCDEINKYRGV